MPKGRKFSPTGATAITYDCRICGFQSRSLTAMKLHEKKNHENINFFQGRKDVICNRCKKRFEHKNELMNHIKNSKCY